MNYDFLAYLWRSETWIVGSALVAFLVAMWVLRGAPPGQAADSESDLDAPTARYRDRIVAAVVVGLIQILLGAFVAISRGILWSLPIFGVGLGLVLVLIAYNRRYRHASPSLRRTIEFSSAFLNATLLAGILIVGNIIAFRYGGHLIDVTREQTYSLSSMTLNQLKSLDQPVKFTMVFGRGPRAVRQRDRVVQLLEAYKAVNAAMIELDNLDPYSDVTRHDELVKRVPELDLLYGGGVVIEYGEGENAQHVVVRNGDLFKQLLSGAAQRGADQFASDFTGEDEVTSALIRLREGKRAKVAFTTGHGEPLTTDLNPRGPGIGNWKARLSKVGCEVVDLNLIQDDIPADASLVIVVSPKSAFKPDEELKLRGFAEKGGPVLLLLGNTEPSGLDEFLKSFNLALGGGLVIDPRSNYKYNADLIFAPTGGNVKHPVIDPFGPSRAALLPRAAPIHVLGQSTRGQAPTESVNPRLLPVPILLTTKYSWAESSPKNPPVRFDPKSGDEQGPLIVAVAVSERPDKPAAGNVVAGKARLVLFSSPSMGENWVHEIEQANLDLLMNAASWLRDRPDTQGIPPHTHVALTLAVDPFLRSRLVLVPSVVAVMLIIALGITVYMTRRQ